MLIKLIYFILTFIKQFCTGKNRNVFINLFIIAEEKGDRDRNPNKCLFDSVKLMFWNRLGFAEMRTKWRQNIDLFIVMMINIKCDFLAITWFLLSVGSISLLLLFSFVFYLFYIEWIIYLASCRIVNRYRKHLFVCLQLSPKSLWRKFTIKINVEFKHIL